ncbi:MAG: hypothetical protein L6R41_003942 [Letrouitia leprolyta]|nr:MAG: hypothetical protein L6R41_003942 [Letrouitia leprolyta]
MQLPAISFLLTTFLLLFSLPDTISSPLPLPALAPAPPIILTLDITVYDAPDCKGNKNVYHNVKPDDKKTYEDSPASKSYRLSKDLGEHEYLSFESPKPYVVQGAKKKKDLVEGAKKGCHGLEVEAFWFLFQKVD